MITNKQAKEMLHSAFVITCAESVRLGKCTRWNNTELNDLENAVFSYVWDKYYTERRKKKGA